MNNWHEEDKDSPFYNFSLSDFKKWMNEDHESKNDGLQGVKVESLLPYKKLLAKIKTDDDLEEVAQDFKSYGGIVLEEDEDSVMIECDSGTFKIKTRYVIEED